VVFTLLGVLGFHILLRDIFPVAQTTLHDPLNKLKLIFCGPVFHKQRKVEFIIDEETVRSLVRGLSLAAPMAL
jgi:hypothetical protein